MSAKKERKAGDVLLVKNYINGYLILNSNDLTSLEGCPKIVNGNFNCAYNQLTSLKGFPEKVNGSVSVANNQLTSLEHCVPHIVYYFDCSFNRLDSFEYFPKYIGATCSISDNKFISFKDIDKHIEYICGKLFAYDMDITSGFSDLFGIDGLQRIYVGNQEIQDITNKYLPTKDLIEFQDEMIKSGYEKYL